MDSLYAVLKGIFVGLFLSGTDAIAFVAGLAWHWLFGGTFGIYMMAVSSGLAILGIIFMSGAMASLFGVRNETDG